jgi:maleylacetoacetate isomerase
MQLYTLFRSSASFRVRIALHLKGVQFDTVSKALAKGEHREADYLALNPQGLIPALNVGGTVLSQSLAIVEYLEETHPQPALLPRDPIARAQVRSMAMAVVCDIHPLDNLRVLNYLKGPLKLDEETVNVWYRHWITTGFTALEKLARQHSTSQRYLYGDSVSLADICLVPQLYNARRFATDLSSFPTLVAIATHLESLPAFAAARPEAQPDAHQAG